MNKRLNQLENAGIKAICVFDGQKLPAKKLTNQKRRESRANAIKLAKECLANGDPKAYSYFCQGHGGRLLTTQNTTQSTILVDT